jgi:hypothetical protein
VLEVLNMAACFQKEFYELNTIFYHACAFT